ncbi:hypothetical protein V8E54_000141 [Elaphomyces granulatus]
MQQTCKQQEGRTDRPVKIDYPDLNPTIRVMGVDRDTFYPSTISGLSDAEKKNRVDCEAQVAIIARPVDSYEDEKTARSILEQASRFDSFSTAEYNGSTFIGNNQGLSFARTTLSLLRDESDRKLQELKDESDRKFRLQELCNSLLFEWLTSLVPPHQR